MFLHIHTFLPRVTVISAVTLAVISCGSKIDTADELDLASAPVQVVHDMLVVQTDMGKMQMRMESPVLERYQTDSLDWEIFPDGFNAYFYNEEGELETHIKADQAKHLNPKGSPEPEIWEAYGHVEIRNLIKRELMQTDTLYWDRDNERIHTDCYVMMVSPSGFVQGYGMESDQRARNSVLYREFNSYGIIDNDSTVVEIDSVNFIGPFQKKEGKLKEN